MIIFIKREDTYKTMCAFDTERKLYCKGNFAGSDRHDLKIFTAQVSDVVSTMKTLDILGFKEVDRDTFEKEAVMLESGLPLCEHIVKKEKEWAEIEKAEVISNIEAIIHHYYKEIDDKSAKDIAAEIYEAYMNESTGKEKEALIHDAVSRYQTERYA